MDGHINLKLLAEALDEHAIVSVTDAAGNITYVNQKFLDISGYSLPELLGRNHRMLKSGIHSPEFYQQLWDTLLDGKTWQGEVCNRRKNGDLYWVRASVKPILDGNGLPLHYISIRTDITEVKQHLQALRESQERWAFAVEGAGDGVWDWNMLTGEMVLSRLYEAMHGYAEHEMTPTIESWRMSAHPDDLVRAQAALQDYLTGSKPIFAVELRIRCKDGGYKWGLCRGTIVKRDADGKPVRMIGIHSDINERKLAEYQLDLFREIVENTAEPVFLIDVADNNRLAYVNSAAARHWGASKDELMTWRIPDWDPTFDEQKTAEHFPEMLNQPGVLLETSHRLKSGQIVPVEVFINARMIDGKPYIFGSFRNISARKNAEEALRSAKDTAERANQAKSDFLASMSHELRTPMNAILGFAQLMEGDASCSADQRENLQQISKAGWHLLDLINEVLDLARVESGAIKLQIEEIAPAEIITECLSLVSPLVNQKRIKIVNHIGAAAPRVRADYMRLKQVLINLLSNAIKYNREGGQVTLDAALADSGALSLSVRDSGMGMSAADLARLFEPFTRFGDTEKVHGTGIGLSICKKLIEGMNGAILVESVLGEGSVFSVVLPPSVGEKIKHPLQPLRISLLYIEDDQAQQSLIGKWIKKQGWEIEFAHDAASGIDAAMQHRYDAILLDIELPGGIGGMDVKAVLNDMESLRNVPVIGISGYAQHEDFERAKQAGFAAYMAKPIDLPELGRTIQRAIRGGAKE